MLTTQHLLAKYEVSRFMRLSHCKCSVRCFKMPFVQLEGLQTSLAVNLAMGGQDLEVGLVVLGMT